MNKQLKLDYKARMIVLALGAKLLELAEEQDVCLIGGHFELSAYASGKVFFSYHPQQYYLESPDQNNESTVSESEQLSATTS